MKLKLPWAKDSGSKTEAAVVEPARCTHPKVDVEMHGTAIKRRWCVVCGQDLPVERR